MAVAIRTHNASNVRYNGSTVNQDANTPSGMAVGDFLLCHIVCRSLTVNMATPASGWTILGANQDASTAETDWWYWKVATQADVDAADTATWRWVVDAAQVGQTHVSAYTGVKSDPASWINTGLPTPLANASSTTLTSPGVTPPSAGMFVIVASQPTVTGTHAAPTTALDGVSWTLQYTFQGNTTTANRIIASLAYVSVAAARGATGNITRLSSVAGVSIGRSVFLQEEPATTPVQSDRALSYDVAALATSNRTLSYDVAAAVASTRVLSFDVRTPVSSERALIFDVVVLAGSQRVLLFDVIGRVSSERLLSYDVRVPVGSSRSASYDVLVLAGADRILTFDVAELVGSNRMLSYDVATLAGSERVLAFDVRTSAASDRVLLFDVAGTLALVSSDRSVLYDVAALTGSERALIFDVSVPATSERALTFDVLTLAQSDRDVLYDVLQLASSERETLFDVLIGTASERDLLFDVIGQVGSERIVLYDVLSLLAEADGVFIVKVPAERTIEVVRPEGFEQVPAERTVETVTRER